MCSLALAALAARVASRIPLSEDELFAQLVLLGGCVLCSVIASSFVLKTRSHWFLPPTLLLVWLAGPLGNSSAVLLLPEAFSQQDLMHATYHRLWYGGAQLRDAYGSALLLFSLVCSTYFSVRLWTRYQEESDTPLPVSIKLLALAPALIAIGSLAFLGLLVARVTESYERITAAEWERTVQQFQGCNLRGSPFRFLLAKERTAKESDPLERLSINPSVRQSYAIDSHEDGRLNLFTQCKEQASAGNSEVWVDVGMFYLAHDWRRAFAWLSAASSAEVTEADVALGHAFRVGLDGMAKNEKAAVSHYAKAARAGSAKGQFYLAEMLESTDGRLAARYYEAAASQGLLAAIYRLQSSFWTTTLSPLTDQDRYFWNLLFDAALNRTFGTFQSPLSYWASESSPSDSDVKRLLNDVLPREAQPPDECALDSVGGCTSRVRRYDVGAVLSERSRLEARLDIGRRSAVQDRAAQFVAQYVAKPASPAPTVQAEARKSANFSATWKPLSAPVCAAQANTQTLNGAETYTAISPFVVTIEVATTTGTSAFGSGVAVSEKEVITNCHVVKDAKTIALRAEGRAMSGKISAADSRSDMCIVDVPGPLRFIKAGRRLSTLEIGETAFSLGHPQGLELTIANGIVSGLRRSDGRVFVQTTTPISKGSSGGALLDSRGNLLGITTFYLQGGQQINFAIPIESFCAPSR
jgi:hypothetical protein